MTDEALITAIISNPTIKTAAKAAGCSESVIYQRLRKREFVELLKAYREEILRESISRVQSKLSSAVETIAAIMNDSKANPQQRLNAAELLIKQYRELSGALTASEMSMSFDDYAGIK